MMKRLVGYLPLPYQIFLSVLTISIFSVIQFAFIDKTCVAQPFTVTCIVEDKSTGDPISQAIVKLINTGTEETEETIVGVTDENGEIIFTGVEADFYDIIADAQCYKQRKKTSVNKQKLSPLNGNETFTFKLNALDETETGSLSGTVKDKDEIGISGATVKIKPDGPTEETAEDGSYIFNCVEVKTKPYKVSADADLYIESQQDTTITAQATTILDFTLFPPKIFGKVTEIDGETFIPDVLVEALRDSAVAGNDKTNKNNGKYAIFLDLDTYIIKGIKFGYEPHTSDELVLGEATLKHDFSLTQCEATLSGKVTDKDSEPIADATVRITDPVVAETTTDSKGKYQFDEQCLTDGQSYTVEAKEVGYKTQEKTIAPAVAGENKLNFKLNFVGTTTTTIVGTTTTIAGTTTTTAGTTTTTICVPCEGEDHDIIFSKTCNSFNFVIHGESGPRIDNLIYKKDGKGRIINVCGTVTYRNTRNIYCVEINVRWGFFCISSIDGIARWIGIAPTTTTSTTTTSSTTTTTAGTTTTTAGTTTTTAGTTTTTAGTTTTTAGTTTTTAGTTTTTAGTTTTTAGTTTTTAGTTTTTAGTTTTTAGTTTTTAGTTTTTAGTTTTTAGTTTTTAGTTTTTAGTTTTTTTGTTTTTICEPCEGEDRDITFTTTCSSFSFTISGESGPRRNNLTYVRDEKRRVIFACGTVTYTNSGNTYCVEITVEWGRTCIKSVQGFAKGVVE